MLLLSPPVYRPRGDLAFADAYASIYTDSISRPDMNFPQPVYYTPPATGAENMFTHGYIGLTFGPHTESFFSSVLKTSPRFLQVGFSAPGWPTTFYIAPLDTLAVSANAMSSRGNLIMVLDYRADLSRGIIVPQVPWFPQTPRDVRKYVTDASLRLPIFLRQDDGTIGMSLSDVVHGNFRRLTDSVQPVNVGGRTSVHIRINVSSSRCFILFFQSSCLPTRVRSGRVTMNGNANSKRGTRRLIATRLLSRSL
jgi:hypothetical protein